jgi:hypothetical protein
LITGIAGTKSGIYHTTHYIYLLFFFSPVFAAIGLRNFLRRFRNKYTKALVSAVIILTCIPLSYIKNLVPGKLNKIFPKIIQFIVTADEPEETSKLIRYIDNNIGNYPSLIFDADDNASSIFYVPFRTRLAPPEKILISSYNVPTDELNLTKEIENFMNRNKKGIIMFRKSGTLMNKIFSLAIEKQHLPLKISKSVETDKWVILNFQ